MRTLAKNLLLLLMLAILLAYLVRHFSELAKGSDFAEFYVAAKMVHAGGGRELYSLAAQQHFQTRYTGRVGVYFNHPPFEALLYLPFSLSSLGCAYLLWTLLNLMLLGLVAWLLQRHVVPKLDWRLQLALMLLFVPVLLNFLQGQDSILLLLLLTLAFVQVKQGRSFSTGCLLACGLFKFHLVLPLLLVLLPGRSRKLLAGFSLVGIGLLLVSAAVSGWGFISAYPRFLMQSRTLPLAGIHPQVMANLRGLTAALLPAHSGWALSVIVITSLLLLAIAIAGWRSFAEEWQPIADLAFANAVMAAILVGYHLSPHDLSILLLPLALIAQYLINIRVMRGWRWSSLAVIELALFLPPVHVLLLQRHHYAYLGLLIVSLVGLIFVQIRRSALFLPKPTCKS